jgi:hypothetical protein
VRHMKSNDDEEFGHSFQHPGEEFQPPSKNKKRILSLGVEHPSQITAVVRMFRLII